MYYDYYSIGYSTEANARAAIATLGPDVGDVAGPFFTGTNWVFSVRSEEILTGTWINPAPVTPPVAWAGGPVEPPPIYPSSTQIQSPDGSIFSITVGNDGVITTVKL
jgi:hypothetical protein